MNKYENYFVLSSSTRLTKGYNKSIIQDFQRNILHSISNDYYELIKLLDRNKISEIASNIEEDSLENFYKFLDFIEENEYGIFVDSPDLFPVKSNEIFDDYVHVKDCIIELDESIVNYHKLNSILNELDNLNCEDIQVWFHKKPSESFIDRVIREVTQFNFLCVELKINDSSLLTQSFIVEKLESIASISKIYLFNSAKAGIYEHIIERENHHPLLFGQIISVTHGLNASSCGVISKDYLSFGIEYIFEINKVHNGCLYKKVTIDVNGNIKNCPHMEESFGNGSIKEVLNNTKYLQKTKINKDQIEICKDCEFRYNCTDCRAFLSEPGNLFSKPAKCGYDPYTNQWKEDSVIQSVL